LGLFNFGNNNDNNNKPTETETTTTAKKQPPPPEKEEEKDWIEKTFEFFFGKPEATPFGLKRFDQNRFPEQYPAVIDAWADPLPGDTPEIAKYIRPLLKSTNLEFRNVQCTYDANRDGWNPQAFHAAVDRKGGGIVLVTTRMGIMAGGYNPKGWVRTCVRACVREHWNEILLDDRRQPFGVWIGGEGSVDNLLLISNLFFGLVSWFCFFLFQVGYGEARGSIAAFLFRINPDNNNKQPFIKLRKVGGAGLAQIDKPETGPSFGADSLIIPLERDNPKLARSKLGSYYERFPDGTNSLFGKDAVVQLRDFKVYHGVYQPGEFIPFTDAEPFALS
jgi:hypothetical protein